jgi:hypothetical protein
MLSKKQSYLLVFIAVLLNLAIAFYNGFPLFTPDSGAYIDFAFNDRYPEERPVFYSLFIRYFSLNTSLFWVVFFQSMILVVLLHLFVNQIFKIKFYQQLILHTTTVLLTSAPWFVSQIMPDIFTPMLFLAMVLFLKNTKPIMMFLYVPIIIFAIICHNSNLLSATILVFILLIFRNSWMISFKRILYMGTMVLFSWLLASYTNYHAGYGFTPNKMSHVFLMGKFSESGVLKSYLNDKCSQKDYKICEFKDELPNHAWDFVWSNNGPFAKTGGWSQDPKEYKAIIRATFIEPKYLLLHISASIKATLNQVRLPYVGDGLANFDNNSSVYAHIHTNFPKSIPTFESSRQNQSVLDIRLFNELYKYTTPILLILCVVILIVNKNKNQITIFLLGLIFVLVNAFTTASFANVLSRLNSRTLWLMSFICLLILIEYISNKSKKNIN